VVGAVERSARQAETLGFADVWVSDHLVVPVEQSYPPAYILDPLTTLAFAAASTQHIGLGTSVLVGPQYASPLALANSLASMDMMSGGRLIVGMGAGWSREEFEALGAPFSHRGERLVELIEILRAAWTTDPTDHVGTHYPSFSGIRVLPKPGHSIALWLGGTQPVAVRRACTVGDGYHGIRVSPENAKPLVEEIRSQRPESTFSISLRITWDGVGRSVAELQQELGQYEEAGVQHLVVAPFGGGPGEWDAHVEAIAAAAAPWLNPPRPESPVQSD
jgi:probable F420-dependent oxidoreductase